MKSRISTSLLLLAALSTASAQVASHASTPQHKQPNQSGQSIPAPQLTGKPVARVNGAVLTDKDLVGEMYAIFPYARQHGGFPKTQEADIRRGAMEMIIFEELVYQDAERRKITVPPAKLNRAIAALRGRFQTPAEYQNFLQTEFKGSRQLLVKRIERSLLIEAMLKSQVKDKSEVSPVELRAYYDKNPARFQRGETFDLQTISILLSEKPTAEQTATARKRADEALRLAKATKSAREFGMLAEKSSDDDFHVNMGEHKEMGRAELPPMVLNAALKMHPGQVSDLLHVDASAYVVFRLNAHNPPGKKKFAEVKDSLQTELHKLKTNQVRSALGKNLRKTAKVEML